MERRYQVFVSSTFTDLMEERQAVIQALLSLEHFPAGMESFPASDDDAWTLIKGVIDDSDYYVVVVGGRYGSTNEAGLSYTEMEFDYAASVGKPILGFLHQAPDEIPSGKTDKTDELREKLAAFRSNVEEDHHVKYWKNADDLKAKVIQAISAETRRRPQEGWVRAGRSSDPVITERLRQEIDELNARLNSVGNTPPRGSEHYAGGDDVFNATISYTTGPLGSRVHHELEVAVTWNQILYVLGPMMMEESNERQMQTRLNGELWRYSQKVPVGAQNISLAQDDFETIKVQLLALGLIRRSERRHMPSDTNKYWSLTPFGETTTMKLRAIAKP